MRNQIESLREEKAVQSRNKEVNRSISDQGQQEEDLD